MKPTIKNLKNEAEKLNAKIEIDVYSNNNKAIQVVAPNGKQWVDGNCVNMLGEYYTYIKKGANSKEDAIEYLMLRMKAGLEDYNSRING